jgi:hypothetical protein
MTVIPLPPPLNLNLLHPHLMSFLQILKEVAFSIKLPIFCPNPAISLSRSHVSALV